VFTDTRTFTGFTRVSISAVLTYLASAALCAVLLDEIMLTSTRSVVAELTNIFPLSWMFFTEGTTSTVLTCIIIDLWVVGAFLLATGLTVVFDISMLALYLEVTFGTLCLKANGITMILTEEMRGAFMAVCLEDDLSVSGTEEVGRALVTGILILLMGTLEAFSARGTRLVGPVEGGVGLFDLAARACTHC
jgi:hypothetical protein